jgi:hypothetical protein
LAEFCKLVVDNMNRVNTWIEWDCDIDGNVTHYSGKLVAMQPVGEKVRYQWGRGSDYGVGILFTEGLPEVGSHGKDPELLSDVDWCVVTAVRQWKMDFPKKRVNPPVYPQPVNHMPDDEYSTVWDVEHPELEPYDESAIATSMAYDVSDVEWVTYSYVDGSTVEGDMPLPTGEPSDPNDVFVTRQGVTFYLRVTRHYDDPRTGEHWESVTHDERVSINRGVTYHPVIEHDWQIDPVTPESGGVTDEYQDTESLLLSYDCHSCLAVLQDLCVQWDGWEWLVEDEVYHTFVDGETLVCGTITMRRTSSPRVRRQHTMGFGRSGGLSSLRCNYADDTNVPSRVYFYGGTQNIPQYYRNTRICLPDKSKKDSYIDFSEMGIFPLGVGNRLCETVVLFDGIFPAAVPFSIEPSWGIAMVTDSGGRHYLQLTIPQGRFFDIAAKWQDNADDYAEWLLWKGYEDSVEHRQDYASYYVEKGVSKYMVADETPMFTFQTGALGGYSLSVHSSKVASGNVVVLLNVVKEPNAEDDGYHVPNATVCCSVGDKFIVDGINMPVSYTYYKDGGSADWSAENALWKASLDYMYKVADRIDYEIETARDYVARRNESFRTFDTVTFGNVLFDGVPTVKRRVMAVELDLVDAYSYKLTVTNRGVGNRFAWLSRFLSQNMVSQSQATNR